MEKTINYLIKKYNPPGNILHTLHKIKNHYLLLPEEKFFLLDWIQDHDRKPPVLQSHILAHYLDTL